MPPSGEWAAPSGPDRSRWRRPSRTPSTPRATCSSRRAPAPGSRWPTSFPPSSTPSTPASPPSSRRRRWRCRRRSSTATCHGSRMPWRPCWVVVPPTRWSRGAATTCVRTRWRAASPTTTPTRSCHSGWSTSRPPGSGPRSCACASGPRSPSPVTATSSCRECPSGPGGRCRSARRSAWAAAARWSPSASSSARVPPPLTSTSSSPTTRSWRSTPSRAVRCCPSTTSSSSTRATSSSTG